MSIPQKLAGATAGLVLTLGLAAAPALAAPTTTAKPTTTTAKPRTTSSTTKPARSRSVRWEASAGKFTTMKAAEARRAALRAKHLTGFIVEREPRAGAHFDVERGYHFRSSATREVAALRKAGFTGRVERA